MCGFDLFEFYRFLLTVLVGSYCVVRLAVFIWRFQSLGVDDPRGLGLLRRYLIVQVLRVRITRFTADLLQIGALLVIVVLLVNRHWR